MDGHIASVHEGKRPLKYNVCDANFSEKGNLKGPQCPPYQWQRYVLLSLIWKDFMGVTMAT